MRGEMNRQQAKNTFPGQELANPYIVCNKKIITKFEVFSFCNPITYVTIFLLQTIHVNFETFVADWLLSPQESGGLKRLSILTPFDCRMY